MDLESGMLSKMSVGKEQELCYFTHMQGMKQKPTSEEIKTNLQIQTTEWWLPEGKTGSGTENKWGQIQGYRRTPGFKW